MFGSIPTCPHAEEMFWEQLQAVAMVEPTPEVDEMMDRADEKLASCGTCVLGRLVNGREGTCAVEGEAELIRSKIPRDPKPIALDDPI